MQGELQKLSNDEQSQYLQNNLKWQIKKNETAQN